ncbi:MAG: hypothetical protein RBT02_11425 [Bacteroidales bacterium]|nr:hypothetical protein [Bacteroidales bacterium]
MKKKIIFKVSAILLVISMLSFASCDTASYCWECVNPRNSSDWQTVCSSMSKVKLESYGYVCTPY